MAQGFLGRKISNTHDIWLFIAWMVLYRLAYDHCNSSTAWTWQYVSSRLTPRAVVKTVRAPGSPHTWHVLIEAIFQRAYRFYGSSRPQPLERAQQKGVIHRDLEPANVAGRPFPTRPVHRRWLIGAQPLMGAARQTPTSAPTNGGRSPRERKGDRGQRRTRDARG